MGHIPILSDKQKQSFKRFLGENQRVNLTVKQKEKSKRFPEITNESSTAPASADIAVLAQIRSGNAETGFFIYLYANGRDQASTGAARLFVPELAAGTVLPYGTWIIAHPHLTEATGGDEE